MTQLFLKELTQELHLGVSEKGHPFRFGTLATIASDNTPRQRTVVLRNISSNLQLTIYTDDRSEKVTHIQANDKVSMLFYHPKKLLQVKMDAVAIIQKNQEAIGLAWNQTPEANRRDYTTSVAPGSIISGPDAVDYAALTNHFCMLNLLPYQIEYLKLKRPNHLRVRYLKENTSWEGQFLVP